MNKSVDLVMKKEKLYLENCLQLALKVLDKNNLLNLVVTESFEDHTTNGEFFDGFGVSCYNKLLYEIGRYTTNKEKRQRIILGNDD